MNPPFDNFLDTQQLYTGSSVPLFTFCQLAKRQFGLKGGAAVSMENFCQPISTEERLGLVFGAVLQLISMREADTAHEAESYVLPENLKDLTKLYAPAYLLCPQATACRGIDTAVHIANAMRDSYTEMVPAAGDAARIPVLLQYIRKKLTSYRNVIKGKIEESHKKQWDIAQLTHTLVGKNRWVYVNYPELDGNKFWLKVDTVLASFRSKSASEYTGALNGLYDMDKTKYGDPANNAAFSAADPSTRPGWQVTLARHAALVTVRLESRKRARIGEADDDMEGTPTD
ncbi:hypothetical protein C8F01DRAFT_1251358 [Mycena amicta]|nr:hypothetical protein C8F01DRAFT_1251358 [Mycena amicta]